MTATPESQPAPYRAEDGSVIMALRQQRDEALDQAAQYQAAATELLVQVRSLQRVVADLQATHTQADTDEAASGPERGPETS